MKTAVYNQEGIETGQVLLPKEAFDVPVRSDLVYQIVVSQMANRRQKIAQTKDRSQVRGGGKKPWRQKGTGRARHGSRRSPIWKGGGVTFGPTTERVFKKTVPQKMKRKALFMVLSAKAKSNLLVVMENLSLESPKTKVFKKIFDKLPCSKKSCLLVLPELTNNTILASRNIPDLQTMQAKDINCLDLLSFKYLMMPKESIKTIKETFLKKEDKE